MHQKLKLGTRAKSTAHPLSQPSSARDPAKRGEISLEQMKALVRNPEFICRKCGRLAHKAESLCDPVPL